MLYLKVAELLSVGLHTAIEQIRAGKLCLSSTVKQGERGGLGWGARAALAARARPWALMSGHPCSGAEAERAVQGERGVLPRPEPAAAALLHGQAAAPGPHPECQCREAYLQPRRADGAGATSTGV